MKTTFSAGPWEVSGTQIVSPERYVALIHDWSAKTAVADQYKEIEDGLKNESIANAKLIAAAPELLEALQLWVSNWDGLDDTQLSKKLGTAQMMRIRKSRNAISKATT